MYIFMPIYSQLSVLLGEKVASLATSQSASPWLSPRLLRLQGRGSWCCAGGRSAVMGWARARAGELFPRYSPPPVAGVCLGSVTLHRDVLHSRLGCDSHPPAARDAEIPELPSTGSRGGGGWSCLSQSHRAVNFCS